MKRLHWILGVGLLVAGLGGWRPVGAQAPTPTPAPAPAPTPAAPAAVVEAAHYRLEVHDAQARAGQPQQAVVVLTGRGGFHVNTEYPTRLALGAGPGVQLARSSVGKKDALTLTEAGGRFPVDYTAAAAGDVSLTAQVSLSVCDAKQCEMATAKLAWTATVR